MIPATFNRSERRKFGKFLEKELDQLSHAELKEILLGKQNEENIILMTDSYKLTHHLLYPKGLTEVYSYMEPRGGDMHYTVFFGLQYYLMKYLAGVRVTTHDIDEAHEKSVAHFGFDCFNRKLWEYIRDEKGGKLPVRICAVAEGTPVKTKNGIMSIVNTDKNCAALTNPLETLLMKIWYTNTVAAYSRHIKELVYKYWSKTSTAPEWLIDFMVHDFGYRGVSSEETAALGGGAHLVNFKGTDTFAGITMLERYYGATEMPGFSVIASEHSVMCSYGGKHKELEAYRSIIRQVKEKAEDFNPASGIIILSLVSDTYNIYRVCHTILPQLKDEFIGWKNKHGISMKIVVRPDSGDPATVLFGDKRSEIGNFTDALFKKAPSTLTRLAADYDGDFALATSLVKKGVIRILMDQFGSTFNDKGFECLNPQIGVLQGDGISLGTIGQLYERMVEEKLDSMNLVFGSGGKLLQAHDRDEQKYAIKATYVKIEGEGIAIEKDPITDAGKKSKKGYLKLVETADGSFRTAEMEDEDFERLESKLTPVFEDGEILRTYTLDEIRKNAQVHAEVIAA